MALKRSIYTDVVAMMYGPMKELCPDVTIQRAVVDQATGIATELDPEDVTGLVFMTEEDGALIFVLDPEGKKNLLSTLTGGVQIAGAGELHKLGGL